jgi:hypothetical protein
MPPGFIANPAAFSVSLRPSETLRPTSETLQTHFLHRKHLPHKKNSELCHNCPATLRHGGRHQHVGTNALEKKNERSRNGKRTHPKEKRTQSFPRRPQGRHPQRMALPHSPAQISFSILQSTTFHHEKQLIITALSLFALCAAAQPVDRGFRHPGGLHTQADFDRIKQR